MYDVAKTFGYDTGADSILGRAGFQYSQGDGVLVYPGSDTVHTPSWGVDGAFPSWRLKMIRRGIQDVDYIDAAYGINPSSTSALVAEMVPEALWEYYCFNSGDCTYSYGGRSWSDDPNTWETARYRLALMATGASPSCGDTSCNGVETCSTCAQDCGACPTTFRSQHSEAAAFKGAGTVQ